MTPLICDAIVSCGGSAASSRSSAAPPRSSKEITGPGPA